MEFSYISKHATTYWISIKLSEFKIGNEKTTKKKTKTAKKVLNAMNRSKKAEKKSCLTDSNLNELIIIFRLHS